MNDLLKLLTHTTHDCFDIFEEVYVFGSMLWSASPTDVDLLLVYDASKLTIVSRAKTRVVMDLSKMFHGLAIHATLLNQGEYREMNLLEGEPHEKIK